jgi:hypothetical protein
MSDLPPLDQPQAYVVVGPNDQRGPYTLELLISEVMAERLSEATPVWWPGLADWTTMGAHPGVADELARRRGAAAPAAPAWAEPSSEPSAAPPSDPSAADPYAAPAPGAHAAPAAEPAPSADQYGAPAEQYGAPAEQYGAPAEQAGASADTFATAGGEPIADEEPVDAEIIEVAEVVGVDPQHGEVFAALVARSAVRAERQSRVDAVNEQLVGAVAAAVSGQGFSFVERTGADRREELRFEGGQGDMVMVSLGRAEGSDAAALREDHVPITITYRSSATPGEHAGAAQDGGSGGGHGEVVVAADEWTGQSTSSVSLFLGLDEYLDEQLEVDGEALVRDVGAAVAVVRSKLA